MSLSGLTRLQTTFQPALLVKPTTATCPVVLSIFECSFCKVVFQTLQETKDHIEFEHPKVHDCSQCELKFRSDRLLITHIKQAHLICSPLEDSVKIKLEGGSVSQEPSGESRPKKRVKCPECNKEFGVRYIERHLITHSSERPYPCPHCGRRFKTKLALTNHLRIHVGVRDFVCDICGKGYLTKHALIDHINTHTDDRPFSCNLCNKRFKTKATHWSHLRLHNRKFEFTCEKCGKSFKSISDLKSHGVSHIPIKERPKYTCDLCGISTVIKRNFNQHMRKHMGGVSYACDKCDRRYGDKQGLKIHLQLHEGIKPFSCEVCGKSFALKNTLIIHRRTHTGERPYECDICHSDFTQRSSLVSHKRKQHNIDTTNKRQFTRLKMFPKSDAQ